MSEATNHDVVGAWLKRLNKIQHESDQMRARIESIRNHRPECAGRFGNPRLIRGILIGAGCPPTGGESEND